MKEEEISVEELSYELSMVLEGMLFFAGVSKAKLEKAAAEYVECIDDALENSNAQGVDEVIEIVKYLKANKPELFK